MLQCSEKKEDINFFKLASVTLPLLPPLLPPLGQLVLERPLLLLIERPSYIRALLCPLLFLALVFYA